MRIIDSYERMMNHLLDWKDGHLPFLVIVGKPGTGKSQAYEDLLKNQAYNLFKGRTSAFEIYCQAYDLPNIPIVFDDVGPLLKDQTSVELMKSLCETRKERIVQWNTSTKKLNKRNKSFTTSAPVLVVCNRNLLNNEDVQAVLDRADAIEFDPPKKEIIGKLRTYAKDEEIVNFLATMPLLPSLRSYELAERYKQSTRLDWKKEVMEECGVQPEVRVLVEICRSEPESNWCNMYMARTGRSQRDYYNKLPLIQQLIAVSEITLISND